MGQVIDIGKFCREHWAMIRPGRPCRKCVAILTQSMAQAKNPSELIALAKKLAAAGGGL